MKFSVPLIPGRLIKRYKRFLVDVALADGRELTAHCPNTGSMMGCQEPGSRVWLSDSGNAQRRYRHTWELVESCGVLVGIHTGRTNALVREAIEAGVITELAGHGTIRNEVKFGANSRVDFLLERQDGRRCYVEVKNVTAAVSGGLALFPDAVSDRASKHLRELAAMVREGHRAAILFCVQRGDVNEVRPADAIDPVYGRTLREVMAQGVEAIAYRAEVSPEAIELATRLPVVCP